MRGHRERKRGSVARVSTAGARGRKSRFLQTSTSSAPCTTVENTLGYSTRNYKFKRLEPHFQLSATGSASKESTETAVALPHSRECTNKPISALPKNGSKEKFGARAELRNILQEHLIGRGGSSCRFDCLQQFLVGNATQVSHKMPYAITPPRAPSTRSIKACCLGNA